MVKDKIVHDESTEHWFQVNFLGISDPKASMNVYPNTLETKKNCWQKSWQTKRSLLASELWHQTMTYWMKWSLKSSTLCHCNWKRKCSCSPWRMSFCTMATVLTLPMMIWSKYRSWGVNTTAKWTNPLSTKRHFHWLFSALSMIAYVHRHVNVWLPRTCFVHFSHFDTSGTLDRHQLSFYPRVSVVYKCGVCNSTRLLPQ